MDNNFIKLSRECDGLLIPSGEAIKLKKGTPVKITQSLGGYFTLYVNGNLVKLDGEFADAIGEKIEAREKSDKHNVFDENLIWEQLKTCYDPEIPVNIVDLGLIYDLSCIEKQSNSFGLKSFMSISLCSEYLIDLTSNFLLYELFGFTHIF